MRTVDTDVVPDRVKVDTEVEPGREIVLRTVDAGKVTDDSEVVNTVLGGN